MISYAGVYLAAATPAVLATVHGFLDPSQLFDFGRTIWPGQRLADLGFGSFLRARPPRLQTLYWPRGASTFAVGYFLATAEQTDRIRQVVYQGSYNPSSLVLADGKRTTTAKMWLLPPRPVLQGLADPSWYLLTLVDDRFFWWFRTGVVGVIPGTTTWPGLYASYASLLGITLSPDPVGSSYQAPSRRLACHYDPVPPLLDAVAGSVGQQVVVNLDGTVRAMSASTSQSLLAGQLSLYTRQGGGLLQ